MVEEFSKVGSRGCFPCLGKTRDLHRVRLCCTCVRVRVCSTRLADRCLYRTVAMVLMPFSLCWNYFCGGRTTKQSFWVQKQRKSQKQ